MSDAESRPPQGEPPGLQDWRRLVQKALGDRDPATLTRSYTMFDATGRKRGGGIAYYESEDAFTDMVGRVLELGVTEIGLYWPTRPEQRPMFERIATGVIPKLKSDHAPRRAGSQ